MHLLLIAALSAALCYTAVSRECKTYCEDEASCGDKFDELWNNIKEKSKREWEAVDNVDKLEKRGLKGKKKPKKSVDERKAIFRNNLKKINKQNKRTKKTWCAKPSPVTTLDKDEREKVLHGIVGNDSSVDTSPVDTSSKRQRNYRQRREAAEMVKRGISVDHRDFTGDVELQECGNCWAYAASHAVVAIFDRFLHLKMDGSEQQLTRCTYDADKDGCEGGNAYRAFDHLMEHGFLSEQNYPQDLDLHTTCQSQLLADVPLVTGWKWADHMGWGTLDSDAYLAERINSMKNELYWQPLVVYMNVNGDFGSYGDGVYDLDDGVECLSVNHAMLVVGFGTDEVAGEYWIIKNSWSEWWGDGGYIKVKAGKNLCNVEALVHFPIEY